MAVHRKLDTTTRVARVAQLPGLSGSPGVSGVSGPFGVVLPGRWLVLAPAGWGEDVWVTGVVAALGTTVTRLDLPQDIDRAGLAARLAELPEPAELAGVVSLLGVAGPDQDAAPAGLAATVLLLQVLGQCGITARVWCVTRAAVSVGPADLVDNPAQTALWGLGGSPRWNCRPGGVG